MVKVPSSLASTVLVFFVASSVISTVAPAIALPFWSTTVPTKLPLLLWANADEMEKQTVSTAKMNLKFFIGRLLGRLSWLV
jgi:hypothetical protein